MLFSAKEWNLNYVSHLLVDLSYSSVSGMSAVPSSVKYQGIILQICNSADAWT